MTQLGLLSKRRYAALFWTQFLGALNDNFVKNALVILVAYGARTVWGLGPAQLVALAGAVFILPFLLFSALAGQLADKFPKDGIIRATKVAEIGVMALALVGFWTDSLAMLLVVLFLMGTQAAFFGPAKYSVLPQLVDEDDLVGANALIETGTFVAILLGTIAGGLLVAVEPHGARWVGLGSIALALAGYATSLFVPRISGQAPELRIAWNPITPALDTYAATRAQRAVFLSVLGISWFWFLGASLLSLLPSYTKEVLGANEHVVTLFLAAFCTGIAVGSLLCERLSERKLELGLVPLGSIGMTLFAADIFFIGTPHGGTRAQAFMGAAQFVHAPSSFRILFDLAGLAIFSGFYTVPLYTLIQQRAEPQQRSRVVAGNNILNALFMVLSALLLMGLFAAKLTIPQIFLVLAILNAAVAIYIYRLLPEFLFRFIAWCAAHLLYRLHTVDRENIPSEGAAVLVCNHVTFIDWLIISSASKRPIRFVMYHTYAKVPLLGMFFRDAKVIPIAPARENKAALDAAFDQIARELESGELVCIFPEGGLSKDGQLQPFRAGIEKIVQRTPVPVVPMALRGLWGSRFSRDPERRLFGRLWSKVTLVVGKAVPAVDVTADTLARQVGSLASAECP